MRERVRFEGVSFRKAGGELYSGGAAFKAIAAYERQKGLSPDQREPEPERGGGEASNCQPPSGIAPADTH